MTTDFFRDMVEEIKDEDTNIATDEKSSGEFSGFIDTGNYALNALLSGSIYKGVPDNKIVAIVGPESSGKSFFVISIMKNFLNQYDDSGAIYYEVEAAINNQELKNRGVDTKRVIIAEPETIQKFRHHALRMVDIYNSKALKKKPRLMFVLDSLGMLSSSKEVEDSTEGKETKDMTKAQIIKATFRVLTLKLAKAKIPLLVTNHVYAVIGSMFPQNEISGGSGLRYAGSIIIELSKAMDKDGKEVVGSWIRCTTRKSRLTKEKKSVRIKLSNIKGLDRYSGLLDIAEKYNIFKKVSTRYELPDGRKVFGKSINDTPEEYYTKEILDEIDKACAKEFLYGEDDENSYEVDYEIDENNEELKEDEQIDSKE